MELRTFADMLAMDLRERIPGIETEIREIEKLQNQSYTSVTVRRDGNAIGFNLNASEIFALFEDGKPYHEIMNETVETVNNVMHRMPDFDIGKVSDYENIRNRLIIQAVSTERNAEMLENIPHKEMADISLVYRIQVDSGERETATVLITNNLIDHYGVSVDQLHEDAVQNAALINPVSMRTMAEVMSEMTGIEMPDMGEPKLYVATVENKVNGAGAIAYPDFMEKAAETLGGDFYLLPSSVHEVLLVRDDGEVHAEQLDHMVFEVNETQVSPEERLSDHSYHYDSKNRVFEIASEYEARIQEAKEISVLSIRPHEHPEVVTLPNDLRDLQLAVAGDIEVVHPFEDENIAIIVNENGKLDGLDNNRALHDEKGNVVDIIAGDFLVVGTTEDGFRSLTPEETRKFEEKFHDPEAFFRVGNNVKSVKIPEDQVKPKAHDKAKSHKTHDER